jgi:hypothetical protein
MIGVLCVLGTCLSFSPKKIKKDEFKKGNTLKAKDELYQMTVIIFVV